MWWEETWNVKIFSRSWLNGSVNWIPVYHWVHRANTRRHSFLIVWFFGSWFLNHRFASVKTFQRPRERWRLISHSFLFSATSATLIWIKLQTSLGNPGCPSERDPSSPVRYPKLEIWKLFLNELWVGLWIARC
jgi:hypothetical protein